MMTCTLSLLLTLSAAAPGTATSQEPATTTERIATGFLYKTLTINDATYPFCVYVPPDYTADKPWPVILFLHGSGECGTDGFLQTDIGIGRAIRRHHERIPAIVVMPQIPPRHTWAGPMGLMALKCVEAASHEYHCDPARVYLTGLSLGGHGAWHMAAALPGRFAAVVPICGFAELRQSTGLAEKLAPRLKNTPIWTFHGDADRNVPVTATRDLVSAIRAIGGRVEYTEYKGQPHNVWDRAYEDPALWKWLFSQSLNNPKRQPKAP